MTHTEPNLPPDLLEVAQRLAVNGPRLTEPELARVRRTVLQRTPCRRRPSASFTRSRVAITSMLAAGALMSSGGVALGISALSTDLTASAAQYGAPSGQPVPSTQTLAPTSERSGVEPATSSSDTDDGTSPAADEQTQAVVSAQVPRQLAATDGGELPFTGYMAIAVLLGGLALLAAGGVLRRGAGGATRTSR